MEWTVTPDYTAEELKQIAADKAAQYNLDPALFDSQIQAESGYNLFAKSPTGPYGPSQFTKKTGAAYGLRITGDPLTDERTNPEKSFDAQARHMSDLLAASGGDYHQALQGYHGGPDQAAKLAYANKVLRMAGRRRQEVPAPPPMQEWTVTPEEEPSGPGWWATAGSNLGDIIANWLRYLTATPEESPSMAYQRAREQVGQWLPQVQPKPQGVLGHLYYGSAGIPSMFADLAPALLATRWAGPASLPLAFGATSALKPHETPWEAGKAGLHGAALGGLLQGTLGLGLPWYGRFGAGAGIGGGDVLAQAYMQNQPVNWEEAVAQAGLFGGMMLPGGRRAGVRAGQPEQGLFPGAQAYLPPAGEWRYEGTVPRPEQKLLTGPILPPDLTRTPEGGIPYPPPPAPFTPPLLGLPGPEMRPGGLQTGLSPLAGAIMGGRYAPPIIQSPVPYAEAVPQVSQPGAALVAPGGETGLEGLRGENVAGTEISPVWPSQRAIRDRAAQEAQAVMPEAAEAKVETPIYDGHAQDIIHKELITKKGGKEIGQEAAKLFGTNPSIVEIAKERLAHYNEPDLKTDKDFDGVRTRLKAFITAAEKMTVKPKTIVPEVEPPAPLPGAEAAGEGKSTFIVNDEGKIARIVGWQEGKPVIVYPGKEGGMRGQEPYQYIYKENYRPANADDFNAAIKPGGSQRMLDLRMWRDDFANQARTEAAPKMKEVLEEGAKGRRREIIEARLRRGEEVPDKLLTEFPDLKPTPALPLGLPGSKPSIVGKPKAVVAGAEPPAPAKEPWMMTREEFINKWLPEWIKANPSDAIELKPGRQEKDFANRIKNDHKGLIEQALAQGRPVPPEVLADYPDLAAKYGKSLATVPASIKDLRKLWPNIDFENQKGTIVPTFGVTPEFQKAWIGSARSTGPIKDQARRLHEDLLAWSKRFLAEESGALDLEWLRQKWRELTDRRDDHQARKTIFRTLKENFSMDSLSKGAGEVYGKWREVKAEERRSRNIAEEALRSYKRVFRAMPEKDRWDLYNKLETNQAVPDAFKPLQKVWRELSDEAHQMIIDRGKMLNYLENYWAHSWSDPVRAKEMIGAFARTLEGSRRFFKERKLPTMKDGMDMGLTPRFANPVDMMLHNLFEKYRYIAGEDLIQYTKDNGFHKVLKLSERAPIGWRSPGDPWANVYARVGDSKMPTLVGKRVVPEEIATILDNFVSPGLKNSELFHLYDKPMSFLNMLRVSLSAFHASFTALSKQFLETGGGIWDTVGGALTLNAPKVKEGLIRTAQGVSPYEFYRSITRSGKIVGEYLNPGKYGGEIARDVDMIIKAGGNVRKEATDLGRTFRDAWSEVGQDFKDLHLFKAAGGAARSTSHWIMDYLVPRIKVDAFLRTAKNEMQKEIEHLGRPLTEVEQRAVLQGSWRHVDNIFGQLVMDNLSMKQGFKDMLRLFIAFPGWNIGSGSIIGGVLKGGWEAGRMVAQAATGQKISPFSRSARLSMQFALGMAFTSAIYGGLFNRIMTGEMPQDWKDLYMPRTGRMLPNGSPERIRLPSYLRDILGMATHPILTVASKLNIPFHVASGLLNNRDYFGVQVWDPEAKLFSREGFAVQAPLLAGKAVMPFGPSSALRGFQERGALSGALSLAGINPVPREFSNTQAMNLMDQFSRASRSEVMTKSQAEVAEIKRKFTQEFRAGNMDAAKTIMREGYNAGKISPTAGLQWLQDAQLPPLASRFRHLTDLDQAIRVYEAGNQEEKRQLAPFLVSKIGNAQPYTIEKNLDRIKKVGKNLIWQ